MAHKKIKSVTPVKATLYGPAPSTDDSLVGLMRKLAKRRDYWKEQHNGKETVLNFSFCIGPDEEVLTNIGYIKASKLNILKDPSVKLWSGKEWVSKKDWINSGEQESYELCFSDDSTMIVSWNHPFMVDCKAKQAFELEEGDFLQTNHNSVPQEESKLSYLYGLFRDLCYDSPLSDGRHFVYFTEEFKDGTDYITDTLDSLGIKWFRKEIYGVSRVVIDPEYTRELAPFFFRNHRHERILCSEIYSDVNHYASYLRGAFDSDGSFVRGMLRLTQTSKILAEQTQHMLEALGFTTTILVSEKSRVHPKYDVFIKGGIKEFERFLDIVGFGLKRKEAALRQYISSAGKINNYKLGKKIKSISRIVSTVYGPVSVDGDWYIANGVYNHNTPFTSKNQCLGPDEFILTTKGLKKMSDPELSNLHLGIWNGKNFVHYISWYQSELGPAFKFTFTDGDSIITSTNHPFQLPDGSPILADSIVPGTKIKACSSFIGSNNIRFSELFYTAATLSNTSAIFKKSVFKTTVILADNQFSRKQFEKLTKLLHLNVKIRDTKYIFSNSAAAELQKYLPFGDSNICSAVFADPYNLHSYLSGVLDTFASTSEEGLTLLLRYEKDATLMRRLLQFVGSFPEVTYIKGIGYKLVIPINQLSYVFGRLYLRNSDLVKFFVDLQKSVNKFDFTREIQNVERVESVVYGPTNLEGGWYISNGVYSHNTPFEFAQCMGGLTNRRTLQPAIDEAHKLGFKFRVGTSSDTSTIAQVLTLGDRRLNKVIYDAYKSGVISYWGGMSCFPKGTLVTTQTAFKDISEIKVGDTLADGSIVMRTMSRKVDELIGIKAASLPTVWMTKNHPVFTSMGDFVEASNLKVGQELLVPIRKRTVKPLKEIILLRRKNQYLPYFEVNLPLNKEFIQFIALYLADGYTSKNRVVIVSGSKHIKYGFDKLLDNISAWFESKGISVRKHNGSSSNTYIKTKHPVFTYQFNSSSLQEWVDTNLGKGAKSKILPDFMFGLSNDLIEDFFEAYSDCSITKGVRIYSTSNKSMALSLEELGFKINKYFSLSERKNGLSDNTCYYLGELKQLQTISSSENFVKCKITKISSKKGDFEVFNLTTSSHVYDVPFRVHNCGKDPLEPFEQLLKEETGTDYETYGGEKFLNVVMPWDFIEIGMTKNHMKERYLLAKAGENSAFGCFNRCVNCGACMISQADLPHFEVDDFTDTFEVL